MMRPKNYGWWFCPLCSSSSSDERPATNSYEVLSSDKKVSRQVFKDSFTSPYTEVELGLRFFQCSKTFNMEFVSLYLHVWQAREVTNISCLERCILSLKTCSGRCPSRFCLKFKYNSISWVFVIAETLEMKHFSSTKSPCDFANCKQKYSSFEL